MGIMIRGLVVLVIVSILFVCCCRKKVRGNENVNESEKGCEYKGESVWVQLYDLQYFREKLKF